MDGRPTDIALLSDGKLVVASKDDQWIQYVCITPLCALKEEDIEKEWMWNWLLVTFLDSVLEMKEDHSMSNPKKGKLLFILSQGVLAKTTEQRHETIMRLVEWGKIIVVHVRKSAKEPHKISKFEVWRNRESIIINLSIETFTPKLFRGLIKLRNTFPLCTSRTRLNNRKILKIAKSSISKWCFHGLLSLLRFLLKKF